VQLRLAMPRATRGSDKAVVRQAESAVVEFPGEERRFCIDAGAIDVRVEICGADRNWGSSFG